MAELTENHEERRINADFMCLTHGQTVPLSPKSCEYEWDDEPCRYAWVDLTPLDEMEGFMSAPWATGVSREEGT